MVTLSQPKNPHEHLSSNCGKRYRGLRSNVLHEEAKRQGSQGTNLAGILPNAWAVYAANRRMVSTKSGPTIHGRRLSSKRLSDSRKSFQLQRPVRIAWRG